MPAVSASANYFYTPVVSGTGYDEAITSGVLYSAQVNVNQPLFTRLLVDMRYS